MFRTCNQRKNHETFKIKIQLNFKSQPPPSSKKNKKLSWNVKFSKEIRL